MDATCVATPFQKATEAMEIGFGSPSKMYLDISAAKDLREAIFSLRKMQLKELHITIIENGSSGIDEIHKLYETSKLLNLGIHPLAAFSVTYRAENDDGDQNPARFMIISNLLSQLNWDVCKKTDLNLHVNFVDTDPRLDLLEELPVNVSLFGKTGVEDQDSYKLKMLEKAYSYLDGCL